MAGEVDKLQQKLRRDVAAEVDTLREGQNKLVEAVSSSMDGIFLNMREIKNMTSLFESMRQAVDEQLHLTTAALQANSEQLTQLQKTTAALQADFMRAGQLDGLDGQALQADSAQAGQSDGSHGQANTRDYLWW